MSRKLPTNFRPYTCESSKLVRAIVRKMPEGLQTKSASSLFYKGGNTMCRTMNELEKTVAEYRNLKSLKEELDEQVKDLEREIIGYLDSHDKLSETGRDFTVKISTCERRTLDSKRLEEDLGSLADYQRISQYRRLYVK